MNGNIDKIIQKLCDKKCFFDTLKENCVSRMKKEFSFILLSSATLTTLIDVKLSRRVQSLCKLHHNRFRFIYIISAKNMIKDRCMNYYKSDNSYEFLSCVRYARAKIEKDVKAFDTQNESIVFERVRENIMEIDRLYREKECEVDVEEFVENLLLRSQDEREMEDTQKYSTKDTVSSINRLTKKIVEHYQKTAMEYYVGNAIIENAVIQLEDDALREYFNSKFFAYGKERAEKGVDMMRPFYLEQEILSRCDNDKKEASYLLYPTLMELLYREKFFQYIKIAVHRRVNDVPDIKKDYIDKKKGENEKPTVQSKDKNQENLNEIAVEEELNEYLHDRAEEALLLLGVKESVLVRLKAGYRLEREEIFNLKLALFNGVDSFEDATVFFEQREDDRAIKDEIFQKVIHSEPLKSKEIGLIFNQTEKQINRKFEYIRTKIKKIGSK